MPTGATITKEQAHRQGVWHRNAHIWVYERDNILVQVRGLHATNPGLRDTSAAGHIDTGEQPVEGAVRELAEELGIRATHAEMRFLGVRRFEYEGAHKGPYTDKEFIHVFLYGRAGDQKPVPTSELEGVLWVPVTELRTVWERGTPQGWVPYRPSYVLSVIEEVEEMLKR